MALTLRSTRRLQAVNAAQRIGERLQQALD